MCNEMSILTRYEVARVVGLRALQLSEGTPPLIVTLNESLQCDSIYVASRELYERKLDYCVKRNDRLLSVRYMDVPIELINLLNTRDGGMRSFYSSSSVSALSSLRS